ncbi:MAG: hypothetical protein JNM43_01980 [Planctomycetaceae bacterium]|nr:hypothetical protein [Planctomycetaceae bacterium]
MTDRTEFSEISILIPGYSIEDLPTDLAEDDAASLLNAIACAWHPRLLAQSSSLPMLRQAESLYGFPGRRVVLVPQCAESWMPHEWRSVLREQDHVVLDRCNSREQWLAAIDAQVSLPPGDASTEDPAPTAAEPALADHFLALGTVIVQLQLLSRRRHHFVDPDQFLLQREATAAAKASLAGDESLVREHLKTCFEHLRDIREKVYPQNCYLIDLLVPGEIDTAESIAKAVQESSCLNLLMSGLELESLKKKAPDAAELLRKRCEEGTLNILGGHHSETRTNLGSMSALISDVERCRVSMAVVLQQTPKHWARRRFGMTASLPTVLSYLGFESALHVALDDGLYPDRERSQFEWQAPDGSMVAAASRIPLAIDSSSGFQKLADRYNESMQDDSVAALFLARLPEVRTPWLHDLQVATSYAPVFGEFATMETLCSVADGGRMTERPSHADYLSPALIQSSVLKTEPPVSGPASLRRLQQRFEAVRTMAAITQIVRGEVREVSPVKRLRELDAAIAALEMQQVDTTTAVPDKLPALEAARSEIIDGLNQLESELTAIFRSRIPQQKSGSHSLFLINTLPFGRLHEVVWPKGWKPPAENAFTEIAQNDHGQFRLLVKMPPGGFVWLKEADASAKVVETIQPDRREPPLAEPLRLRNRHFEVAFSDRTGGIESIHVHNRRGNRLSQLVTFRYEREQIVRREVAEGEEAPDEELKTNYAMTRVIGHRVLEQGLVFTAMETTTEVLSPSDSSVLGRVVQVTRVDRVRSRVEIEVTLDQIAVPPRGNPWLTGWCCRFAWDNEIAAVTRSVLGQAAGFRLERIESPDYVEISDAEQRMVIVGDGRPWHRRSGPRMLDSLLLVEGETERTFRFVVDFDQPFPLRSAEEMLTPVIQQDATGSVPTTLPFSWILGLSSKNVQLVRSEYFSRAPQTSDELSLILSETEGLETNCTVRVARKPTAAFAVNASRSSKIALSLTGDGVVVPMLPFQLKEVLLVF